MTASTLQIVDPSSLSTVLFDLNDASGAANVGGVKTAYGLNGELVLTKPQFRVGDWESSVRPGGSTTIAREGLAVCLWRQRLLAVSVDNLTAGVGELARLLRLGGVLKWIPDGSALTKYVDFEPSERPALFDGRPQDLSAVVRQFHTPRGIQLTLRCQPSPRGADLDPTLNKLINDSLLITTASGRPDSWAWSSTTGISSESIDAVRNAYTFTAATTATRSLTQTYGTAAPGDVWSASFSAWASDNVTAQMRVQIDFLDAGSAVLATTTGTLVLLSTGEKRLTVTSAAAPASTAKVRMAIQISNVTSTAVQHWVRFAQLEKTSSVSLYRSAPQTAYNDPASSGGRAMPVFVQGDAPAPVQFKLKAEGGKLVGARLGIHSGDGMGGRLSLPDYLNTRKVLQSEAGTLTNNTATAVDANASPGSGSSCAECTFASNPTVMAKRVRHSLTTLLDSMRGTWDVWLRAKNTAASKVTVQLRASPNSTDDPAAFSSPEVVFETTGGASFTYIERKLGTIMLPWEADTSLLGLILELWARRDSGSGNFRFDFLTLVPAEASQWGLPNPVQTRLYVPGFSREQWFGKDVIGGGTASFNPGGLSNGDLADSGRYRLNAINEACGTPPVAGLAWPVGRHRVTFLTHVGQGTGDVGYDLRVRNVTDSNNVVSKSFSRGSAFNSSSQDFTDVLEFDSVAAKSYQPQMVYTSATTRRVDWTWAIHEFVPYLAAGEQIRADPRRGSLEKLDSSDRLLESPLASQGGVPAWLPPGLHIVYFAFDDVPIDLYADGESVLSRAPTLLVTHAPRYAT